MPSGAAAVSPFLLSASLALIGSLKFRARQRAVGDPISGRIKRPLMPVRAPGSSPIIARLSSDLSATLSFDHRYPF